MLCSGEAAGSSLQPARSFPSVETARRHLLREGQEAAAFFRRRPVLYVLSMIIWLIPSWAIAQDVSSNRKDQLAVLQRIMPIGASCKNLDWEPVSYCRHYSKGATLEIWTGANGPGASLSFDALGNEGLAFMKIVKTHFLLLGISVKTLNECIQNSRETHIKVAGRDFDLGCHVVDFSTSLALEIFPAPPQD
jgi:hypothetical protein